MEKVFEISTILFENDYFVIVINKQEYRFQISTISKKLADADEQQRNNYLISPSGYGIHWPTIDEDLSVNGLLNLVKNRHVA
ncbi:MAG: DUF2442 domain-containing protein [Bacteroidota bacterium]